MPGLTEENIDLFLISLFLHIRKNLYLKRNLVISNNNKFNVSSWVKGATVTVCPPEVEKQLW